MPEVEHRDTEDHDPDENVEGGREPTLLLGRAVLTHLQQLIE